MGETFRAVPPKAASGRHGWKRDQRLPEPSVTETNVAASTQNQALCAIVILYREVLKKDIADFGDSLIWANKSIKLPEVFTPEETSYKKLQTPTELDEKLLLKVLGSKSKSLTKLAEEICTID